MITITMSYSPQTLIFPAGERLFPVGKVGVLILYPDNIVGVWSRVPGGWKNKVAGDQVLERGLLRPLPETALAARRFFEDASASVLPTTGALALPRLMVRVPAGFDPADADTGKLLRNRLRMVDHQVCAKPLRVGAGLWARGGCDHECAGQLFGELNGD